MLDSLHSPEFRQWVAIAEGRGDAAEQGAAQELLAEHHMMTCVLIGLEHEAGELVATGEMRPAFWRDAVDFIGNFVHQCHRKKEEQLFFPAARQKGLIDAASAQALEREHSNARELTVDICEGYQAGDWERVMRIVSIYAYLLRPHMSREERTMVGPLLHDPDDEASRALARSFRDVEAAALEGTGRLHYLEAARRLCAGLPIAKQLEV